MQCGSFFYFLKFLLNNQPMICDKNMYALFTQIAELLDDGYNAEAIVESIDFDMDTRINIEQIRYCVLFN